MAVQRATSIATLEACDDGAVWNAWGRIPVASATCSGAHSQTDEHQHGAHLIVLTQKNATGHVLAH
jgi:hypothetical protein